MDQLSDSQTTDWSERALRAEARLAEVLEERARLWEELHALRAERSEERYFQQLYRALESSVSWKVTRPLRSAKVLAAKFRRLRDRRRS